MVKIKGKVNDLKKICKLIRLSGKMPDGSSSALIDNFIMDCKPNNSIEVKVFGKTNSVMAILTYKKVITISEGEIPIGNIDEFEGYLGRFGNFDEITLEDVGNKLKMSRDVPKKVAFMPLTSKENIDDSIRAKDVVGKLQREGENWKFGNTKYDTFFIVNNSFMLEVLGDGDVQGLTRKYPISINNNNVTCKVGEETGGQIESQIPFIKINNKEQGEVKSVFMAGIDNVFKGLEDNVIVHLKSNAPMIVEKKSEEYDVVYVIAPCVEGT